MFACSKLAILNQKNVSPRVTYQRADMIVAPIIVDYNRRSAVDPTYPVYAEDYVIMYKLPDPGSAKAWVYLQPFKDELWWSICASVVLVTLVMKIFTIISPAEPGGNIANGGTKLDGTSGCLLSYGTILQQGDGIRLSIVIMCQFIIK